MYIKDILIQGSVLGVGCIVKLITIPLYPSAGIIWNKATMSFGTGQAGLFEKVVLLLR
jgi:hypothetical protein